MSKLTIILLVALAGSKIPPVDCLQKDWRYVLHKFEWNCTNENVLAAPLSTIQIAPSVYGINGTIIVGSPLNKDYKVTAKFLRSPSGTGNYQMTLFGMPRTSFTGFMNTLYKKLLMNDLAQCSNLPVFERFKDPLAIGEYYLNACVIRTDSMPSHVQEGFYKFIVQMDGPLANFISELNFQILKTP